VKNLYSMLLKLIGIYLLTALGTGALAQSSEGGVTDAEAKSILEKAERVRFPAGGFEVQVTIQNVGPQPDVRRFRVLSKGNDKTVAMLTEPASDRGQILLMNGRDFWVYMPNLSQPIRLPLSQKLSGQVANGDIARANFLADYAPKFLRTENIEGDDYYVLELNAAERGVTYHRIVYWVKKSNFHPHKAEFYGVSGNLLKTCSFEEFKNMAGRTRPTKLVLTDALRKGEQSVLEYSGMTPKDFPDRTFTKDYLRRIE
jgi:outer membrane lipoprotein-sorting protein